MKRVLFACAAGLFVVGGCDGYPAGPATGTGTPAGTGNASSPNSTNAGSSNPSRPAIIRTDTVPNGVTQSDGLTVPKGFKAEILAEGFSVPRRVAFAPGGTAQSYDIFLAESKGNRITVLRTKDGKVAKKSTFTSKTNQPYGIAFTKGWVYVGNTDSVVRFPYKTGDLATNAKPEPITKLTEGGYNQHWTRNLIFSPDDAQLFVTVGSSCNTCVEDDSQRAAISVMKPDGSDRRLYATGLRNPVGLAYQPGTNELWTAVNERDNLGDDVPPDYITKVKDGGFYGWPYAYTDISGTIHPDPTFGSKNPEKVKATIAPSVPVQAHSACLGVTFYPAAGGTFPADYRGDAFLSYHGSWNRSAKTGYKIVRVHFENGRPASVSDFVQGFLKDGDVWGRPVDVNVAPDGSLIFTDDGRGRVWRVTYTGTSAPSQ